jgi:IS30 family transposase
MKTKNYTRLTYKDRVQIEILFHSNFSVSEIALKLKRTKSTISREIKRGLSLPGEGYSSNSAQWHADFYSRIKKVDSRIRKNSKLRFYMFSRLKLGWSPEQIAERLKLDYPRDTSMRISYESIYKYIYFECKGKLQQTLIKWLPYSKPKRYGKHKRKFIYMGSIIDRTTIDERPKHIDTREEEGHWEGDLVIGKGQTSAIGTLVERKTRYTIIVHLQSRKSKHVVEAFAKAIIGFPPNLRRSLTYDNGIEMAAHKDFKQRTQMDVFFAHPYSSWERGTNENTNGLIRRVLKKKTDFNTITPKQLKDLEYALNNRPRKVIGFYTPSELIAKLAA